jgi:hypothetical protein
MIGLAALLNFLLKRKRYKMLRDNPWHFILVCEKKMEIWKTNGWEDVDGGDGCKMMTNDTFLCYGDLYSHYSKQFKIKSEYDSLKNIWLGQQTRCKQFLFCSHVSFVIILHPSPPSTSSHPLVFHISIFFSQTNIKCQGLSLNILSKIKIACILFVGQVIYSLMSHILI